MRQVLPRVVLSAFLAATAPALADENLAEQLLHKAEPLPYAPSLVGTPDKYGKFVHASSRSAKEVVVSDITEKYWAERFDGARRILP